MRYLKISKSYVVKLDRDDFDFISQWSWSATINGTTIYAVRNSGGKRVYMHRLVSGAKSGQIVDHINRDSLDNRKKNLRISSKSFNGANSVKRRTATSSKYKGVYWCKCYFKWTASITKDRKKYFGGRFASELSAGIAANNLYLKLFGEHACLNKL